MSSNNNSPQQYNTPADFVNVKRVRQEKDNKGRDQVVFTFGLGKDKQGNVINGCDQLIAALQQYKGKQVNLDFRVEEKTSEQGRTFPSAFVRIVEMIPKDDAPPTGGAKTAYVPKPSKADAVKANAARLAEQFKD